MPDVPAVHDIATPRRTVGGRCRKWCISAQPASGKRKCAAYNLCGIRFTHGEARLQQWGNRETNHHYVHAHCVNGGLGHDHELFPKQATDQDAVDAVTRQRDTMTRTAADTKVLLPFAQDLVRAECDVAPVQSTTRRTDKRQMQSRIRKVATLARTGEKGRALAAPETHHQVQSPNKLFKRSRASILRTQSHRRQRQLQFQPCSCQK